MSWLYGVDLSTKLVAVSEWADEGRGHKFVQLHQFPLSEKKREAVSPDTYLAAFRMAERLQPESPVYLESPYVSPKKMAGVNKTFFVSGAFQAGLRSVGCAVKMVPAPTWKKAVVNRGHATKMEVADWVKANYAYVWPTLEQLGQDAVDAFCVGLYGVGDAVNETLTQTMKEVQL